MVTVEEAKGRVRSFWETSPCGTRELVEEEASAPYFARLERDRDRLEPFIATFARFDAWRGQRVLDVGIGAGTDFVRFVRAGAMATGVDLTNHSVELCRKRLALEGLEAEVRVADAEALPFQTGAFDFVYSWGVLHHTPDTARALGEVQRVLRPGGELCVMLYNRHSLVALQAWVLYGLLRGRPWSSLAAIIAAHVESPGTRAYRIGELRRLFGGLQSLRVEPVVTAYDLRVGRRRFLPSVLRPLVPKRLGWFLVVTGRRPGAGGSAGE
jgi:SAM-dependent methyltransferase